ncbi:hypothetical protein FAZ69_19505 [Trinickia terrae]|uniref:Uncharacterized protein n=1 Tax=Trinickia terrae TaxID=2571161 RepID=A0A4U1I112_9BURK|nr:hypothetical protein [Trinickia terrae]TKC86829.1 hypothetical protein FAZ69_19505 [Trinickia terrae]
MKGLNSPGFTGRFNVFCGWGCAGGEAKGEEREASISELSDGYLESRSTQWGSTIDRRGFHLTKLLRNDGSVIGAQITLVAGDLLPFKVSGLGPDRRHLILMSDHPAAKVMPVSVNHRDVEQRLTLKVSGCGVSCHQIAHVEAYVSDERGHPLSRDLDTPRLTVQILPRLELPPAVTETGMLARMLISENAGPENTRFVSLDEAREAMQWMVVVLRNRLKLGASHFAAGRDVSTLEALIKAPNQVDGFEKYPSIGSLQQRLIDKVIKNANDGTHRLNKQYRDYLETALAVARSELWSADPCPTGLYAWRTNEAKSPGNNFVQFATKGGQDFYTLTNDFISKAQSRAEGRR